MKLFRRLSRKKTPPTDAKRTRIGTKIPENAARKKKYGSPPTPNRRLVQTGYATKGSVIAKVISEAPGHEGKNVFGETLPSKPPYVPKVTAGTHVRAEGNSFMLETDGRVKVYQDARGTYCLEGEPYRRGRARVRVSDDEMEAYLTVTPPVGGSRAVTLEDVMAACEKNGVVYGLGKESIRSALEQAHGERIAISDVVIARGTEPVNGRDGQVEFRVPLASGTAFKVREDGSVDYKEHDNLTTVEEGTLIAVVLKAEEGRREGTTVRGERIPPRQGENVQLAVSGGIEVTYTDEGLRYIAQSSGQVIVRNNKISVEPVYTVRGDVGPHTGNIRFNGDVVVHGNVLDGYRIHAEQSILVNGNVGCCALRSGKDIQVKNGVVGRGRGVISARGDVSVKFAENADIRAGGSIQVARSSLNSRMIAGGWIVANKEKGHLVGGTLYAREGLDVRALGNESEQRTEVHVGRNFLLALKLEEVERRLQRYRRVLKSLLKVMQGIKKSSARGPISGDARQTYREAYAKAVRAKRAVQRCISLRQELHRTLNRMQKADVLIRETVYPGVSVHFGEKSYVFEQKQTGVKLRFDRDAGKIQLKEVRRKQRKQSLPR